MERRDFLKTGATAAAVAAGLSASADTTAGTHGRLARRPFGDTGVHLSIIGFGGIVVMNSEPAQAKRVVAEAVERGVNYFDVAPSYGNAEEKLGPALEPYRKDVFLACKTGMRDREGAENELNRSLKRLRTDHFDLYQLHGITDVAKDVDAAFAKGGAMELLIQAKQDGRIRFLGFSAHSTEAALEAMDRFQFDSILFPFNFATFGREGFGPEVLTRAQEKGVARLALKGMAKQLWAEGEQARTPYAKCWYEPLSDPAQAELAMRWTLSRPITAALPPGEESLFRMALDIGERFTPVTSEEEAQLRAMADELRPIFTRA